MSEVDEADGLFRGQLQVLLDGDALGQRPPTMAYRSLEIPKQQGLAHSHEPHLGVDIRKLRESGLFVGIRHDHRANSKLEVQPISECGSRPREDAIVNLCGTERLVPDPVMNRDGTTDRHHMPPGVLDGAVVSTYPQPCLRARVPPTGNRREKEQTPSETGLVLALFVVYRITELVTHCIENYNTIVSDLRRWANALEGMKLPTFT